MKLEQMMQKIKKYKRYKYWKRRKCILLTNNLIVNTLPKESIGNLLKLKFELKILVNISADKEVEEMELSSLLMGI